MVTKVEVTKAVRLPDKVKLARYRRAPELGPRLLFLSGGSALRKLSRVLKYATHNSVHLITPFDSGGSSAHLRHAFHMLAVGDLRNRLMALADESALGNIEMYALFAHRFSPDATQAALLEELQTLIDGIHPLTVEIPEPLRLLACQYLQIFYREMPETFDLRGASIGNLILAGGYLAHNRNIDTVIFLFSQLANVRGRVQPIVDVDVHLAALLEDGTEIVGQHLLTGKEFAPPASPVARLRLVDDLEDPKPITAEILPKVKKLIAKAEVICFPIGSFYSSVLANILPRGVGRQIRKVVCPKVYVPNLGVDPEQVGMTLSRSVATLIAYLRKDA